jgi:Stress responsive A/B Barrel Domain
MKTFFALTLAALLSSCATIAPPAPKGSVDHVVMFWQKKPGDVQDRQKITAAMDRLRVIEGITFLDYGTAVPSDRPVVDDSFDVALLVRFKNADALHAYESDPRHTKEVKEVLLPLTKKIQVYDFTR